jgi:hypothetical protein
VESVSVGKNRLALLLLLIRKSIATYQLVYYLVSLRQLSTLHQLDTLLY